MAGAFRDDAAPAVGHGGGPRTAPRTLILLNRASGGDREAVDQLFELTYEELRSLARIQRGRWTGNATMSPTVLVHEAYGKLVESDHVSWKNRAHFLAVASRAMRQVLVNYARDCSALKRGGGTRPITLERANPVAPEVAEEVLALHAALSRLEAMHPRRSRIVECRFFGGMTVPETAEVLSISPSTVEREWSAASLWLRSEITGSSG
ncbi:MAG: RNA polymerase subunit sigma-70 [Gemmatimonadales bacterium]|nr:MAG: RNA polymerase subunit sigma-70 [Gemmatimonadales bacterium]